MKNKTKTYWQGEDKNGQLIVENEKEPWSLIKNKLTKLKFISNGQTITLPDNMEYIQAKTCCADMATGECEIESRYIGFKNGNNKIIVRINEKTQNISIELDNGPF